MSHHLIAICAKRCDQCLFSDAKIVSDKRKAGILEECSTRGAEKHFICHKHTQRDGGSNVICRGFYDANPGATGLMQVADRLGLAVLVDESGHVVGKAPRKGV